jgi:hypothetical protein
MLDTSDELLATATPDGPTAPNRHETPNGRETPETPHGPRGDVKRGAT